MKTVTIYTDAEEDESTGSAENVENSAEATEESE